MQTTTLLEKKLHRRFDTWDIDGNGYLEVVDFIERARLVAAAAGVPFDSADHRDLHRRFLALWRLLAEFADADQDGRITRAEFCTAFTSLVTRGAAEFDHVYRPLIQGSVDALDTDGDGRLNRTEWRRWYVAFLRLPLHLAETVFQALDRDSDGYLTVAEILYAVRDYYFNDDADSPSNQLLGPMQS
ncbi:calcium-binding protein [Pseudonocardiaceae bacterium YIM PH 21723]|nr:calcium-binding protein [Pseudonocardiaceae bacterium YIM PH 21723]